MFAQIDLEARYQPRRIDRYYTIIVSRDLFGEICIQTIFGRKGFSGHKRFYHALDADAAALKINIILRKRLNALKRLGTNYHVVQKIFNSDFEKHILKKLMIE